MKRHLALCANAYRNWDRPAATARVVRFFTTGTLLFAFSYPGACVAEQHTESNNTKLAEIAAMARHNEKCPDVPRQWAVAYLILLVMAPPAEDQVETQKRKTLALRREIGMTRWCQLYSVEMEEAYLIYQYAKRR